jgi:type IV secretory pathway ATPase VirB11/archaellum biosynthesis ATPase
MKTCSLNGFMEELTPWLSKEYIREVYLNESGAVVVEFLDATRHVYRIDDCNTAQIKAVLNDLKKQGIRVAN